MNYINSSIGATRPKLLKFQKLILAISISSQCSASAVLAQDANSQAIAAYKSGDYAKAESLYRTALSQETNKSALAAIYRNMAILYEAQHKDAAEFTKKAEALDPQPQSVSPVEPQPKPKSSEILTKGKPLTAVQKQMMPIQNLGSKRPEEFINGPQAMANARMRHQPAVILVTGQGMDGKFSRRMLENENIKKVLGSFALVSLWWDDPEQVIFAKSLGVKETNRVAFVDKNSKLIEQFPITYDAAAFLMECKVIANRIGLKLDEEGKAPLPGYLPISAWANTLDQIRWTEDFLTRRLLRWDGSKTAEPIPDERKKRVAMVTLRVEGSGGFENIQLIRPSGDPKWDRMVMSTFDIAGPARPLKSETCDTGVKALDVLVIFYGSNENRVYVKPY